MARAPDKRIEQAKEMYLQGQKLVEIASQLNLPEGTVRRWKCTHKWDNERSDKKSERSKRRKEKKKVVNQGTKMLLDHLEIKTQKNMDFFQNISRRKPRRFFQLLRMQIR